MRRRIGIVCLVFVLAMLNMASVSATEVADFSQMCPEEIAFREQIGMTDDTPQVPSTYLFLTTAVGLDISSSGDAMCSAVVSGGKDIKKVQIFLYLKKYSTGNNETSWEASKDGDYFSMVRHHDLTERGTYIVKMSAYVQYQDGSYKNLVDDSHTDTY